MGKKRIILLGNKLWNTLENIMKWVAYQLLGLNISNKLWNRLMQFIKFGLVGGSNTVISYVTFLIALTLGLHYILSNMLGFLTSILNAFFWNSKVVFRSQDSEENYRAVSFLKSSAVYIFTGLVLSNVLLYLEVNLLAWSEFFAPLVNLIVTIPLNFVLNKLWVFRDHT